MQLRASSQMGRLGGVTIAYYLTTTGIAVLIGLIVVLFYHPWTAFPPLVEEPNVLGDLTAQSARLIDPGDGSTFGLLNNLVQRMLINPFDALAEMNVLGILVGAILLGLAAAITLPTDSALPKIFDELAQASYKLAGWVLTTLPIGLFAITFQLAQKIDLSTLAALGQLAGVVFGATLFHGLIVLPAIAWLVSGKNPLQFLRAVSQPMVTALFTSSSAATLPLSMQTAQEKLGVDQARSAFVLPWEQLQIWTVPRSLKASPQCSWPICSALIWAPLASSPFSSWPCCLRSAHRAYPPAPWRGCKWCCWRWAYPLRPLDCCC